VAPITSGLEDHHEKMNGIAGALSASGQLHVRALYDYDAKDDRTSLSFSAGEIIQVITQLESGWWDGVLHGVRGWFPSNYCAVVNQPYDDGRGARAGVAAGDFQSEESEDEYSEHGLDHTVNGISSHHNRAVTSSQEEAAFWIPQATPDGRLFYFNTLTGESTMELPLEAPMSANESGPRDRTNIYIPDQTRPPPELMAAGYERDDDTDYASTSETEDASMTRLSKGSSVSIAIRVRVLSSFRKPHVALANKARISSIGDGGHMYPTAYHLPLPWTH